jgi:oligopeptide/dipeptide ABC transporter ATP-binding protein
MSGSGALLHVDDLKVSFTTDEGVLKAVDGVSFDVAAGEVVAIVGESGSGKSVSGMTLMGLTRSPNTTVEGVATLNGMDLLGASEDDLRKVRGNDIAMIFQDPMSSLNPVYRVGDQIVEQIRVHNPEVSKSDAMARAVELMERVGVPRAAERLRSYPHEFSGGMRQRVMIAMALLCEPEVLIADEPTTALDATVQAQITQLLRELQRDHGTAIVMITHDLGVVAGLCDDVMVMYGGRVMEHASAEDIFHRPSHPYTRGLLAALPRMDASGPLVSIPGNPPNMNALPPGCPFSARCRFVEERCVAAMPLLQHIAPTSPTLRACHRSVAELDAMEAADV